LAQKFRNRSQQLAEVHPGSAQNGIDPVSGNTLETVAIHAVLGFQVPNARLNGGSALHPAPKAFGCPSPTAFIDMDL